MKLYCIIMAILFSVAAIWMAVLDFPLRFQAVCRHTAVVERRLRMPKFYAPVDPQCPEVVAYTQSLCDDPVSIGAPLEEIVEDFEQKHRARCRRCLEYGMANMEAT